MRLQNILLAAAILIAPAAAQTKKTKPAPAETAPAPQKLDEEYTKLIKQYLQDSRVTTELVEHMPASDKLLANNIGRLRLAEHQSDHGALTGRGAGHRLASESILLRGRR